MYMSTLPPPFGAFGWIYFAKIRFLYDIWLNFSKKVSFKKKQLKNGWKTNGRWLEDTPLRSGIFQPLKY